MASEWFGTLTIHIMGTCCRAPTRDEQRRITPERSRRRPRCSARVRRPTARRSCCSSTPVDPRRDEGVADQTHRVGSYSLPSYLRRRRRRPTASARPGDRVRVNERPRPRASLWVFFEANRSCDEGACRLGIHKQTSTCRIRKVEDLPLRTWATSVCRPSYISR